MCSEGDHTIVVEKVTKAYRIWKHPAARLKYPFLDYWAKALPNGSAFRNAISAKANAYYRDFFALRDVSLRVRKGESIGIIGRNGSGKSTLLQIIAGTLQPTAGTINIQGRVAALLELGSGFNPDFTGRDNVYLNASVLGLSQAETEARFENIAAFAGIGDFMDQPVKTYSSGMVVRLAFAVAAHVEPEILIVDEALSVGDARFQLKCASAIDRYVERGITFLFVSHDLNMVKRLCSRAILLEQGQILYCGAPNDVANLYSKLISDGGSFESIKADIDRLKSQASDASSNVHYTRNATEELKASILPITQPNPTNRDSGSISTDATLRIRIKALETALAARPVDPRWAQKVDALINDEQLHEKNIGSEYSYGGDLGRILGIQMLDMDEDPRTWFTTGTIIVVRLDVEALADLPSPIFALTIKNPKGVEVYGTNTLYSNQPAPSLRQGDRRIVRFKFTANLMPGEYFLSLGITQFVGDKLVVVHRRYDSSKFSIHGTDRSFGVANCFAHITVDKQ